MSCDVRPTCQVAECQVGHLSVQQKHHHMGLIRTMKITLAKRPSLSGYGRSRSVLSAWLVGVEVNPEGALLHAWICQALPINKQRQIV